MVWTNTSSVGMEDENSTIYDLRRIYAEKILGITLQDIKLSRKTQNFPEWFRILKRDLRTEISQKLSPKELEEVNNKIDETKKVLSENSYAYTGKSRDANDHDTVEEALCKLEMCMTRLMEKHKMYGSKEEDEGLF